MMIDAHFLHSFQCASVFGGGRMFRISVSQPQKSQTFASILSSIGNHILRVMATAIRVRNYNSKKSHAKQHNANNNNISSNDKNPMTGSNSIQRTKSAARGLSKRSGNTMHITSTATVTAARKYNVQAEILFDTQPYNTMLSP